MYHSSKSENLPFVSIIVVNYNGRTRLGKLLDECIQSILKTDYPDFEILFIDNASTDDSLLYVKERFGFNPKLKTVLLDRNYGYSEGANKGVNYAKGELIAVLNNDVVTTPSWLKEAVWELLRHRNAGIVTSKIRIPQPFCETAGGEINILLVGNDRQVSAKEPHLECFHPSGAAFIIQRKILEIFGELFDSEFFAYFEDVDLGWRCQLLDLDVLYSPASLVFHKRWGSFGGASPSKFHLMRRNALRSATKNVDVINLFKLLPLWLPSTLYAAYLFYKATDNVAYLTSGMKVISRYILDFRKTWKKHVKIQALRKVDDKTIFAKFSGILFVDQPHKEVNRLALTLIAKWLKICNINIKMVGLERYPTLDLMKTNQRGLKVHPDEDTHGS